MSQPPISHGHFTIERTYEASPAQVFAAWADPAAKARWFIGPQGWSLIRRELDFRVGGEELLHGRYDTRETVFRARFHEIVPDARIVYVYDMYMNETHHSLSLATVEVRVARAGTTLTFNEQVAFLDGTDGIEGVASRQHGTGAHLDRLANEWVKVR